MRAVDAQLQPEDEFAAAREQFAQMEAFVVSDDAHSKTHSELERELEKQGRELLRRLYQAHLELRAPGEAAAAVRDSQGEVREQSRRQERGLETIFGEVRVERLGYGGEGLQSLHPLDADLNLPPELYSHQVRRRAADEAAEGSFDKVVEALSKTTGAQVGKRQVQELVGRAAQDFDTFYEERQAGALQESESGSILVISVDGKGVVLRREDLREATRQRAEASEHKAAEAVEQGGEAPRQADGDGRGGVHSGASDAAPGGGDAGAGPTAAAGGKESTAARGQTGVGEPGEASRRGHRASPRGSPLAGSHREQELGGAGRRPPESAEDAAPVFAPIRHGCTYDSAGTSST